MRTIYKDPQGGKHYAKPKSLVIGNRMYTPPTDEQLTSAGWTIEEELDPVIPPYVPTYAELVENYIKEHGYPTYGAELAVLNNYATDPTTYADAFAAYQQTRIEAKAWADAQPHRAEEGE